MSERVVQYVDRAMVGKRIEISVYKNEKVVIQAAGRLSRYTYDMTTMSFYFEGSGTDATVWFNTRDYEFLITWDPEETD